MITAIVYSALAVSGWCSDTQEDPRSKLETAIPYFIRLLEEEKYDEFIDKAIRRSVLEDILARQSRDELINELKGGRKRVLELLKVVKELKGEPFEPLLKEDETGMRYRLPDGKVIINFYKRMGLWYGSF